jgi:hypothetical protein
MRNQVHRASPNFLLQLGEAVTIGALVVILFFNFWFGILTLFAGLAMALNGYRLARLQRSEPISAYGPKAIDILLKRLMAIFRKN